MESIGNGSHLILGGNIMPVLEMKPGIYYTGAQHWDRRLFDDLIPLPDGTSYNSYVIIGSEKTALIDTIEPELEHKLLGNLDELGIEKIDYLISHHAEQDHSGTLPKLVERYPMAKVVTNAKCRDLLMEHLLIPEQKFLVVGDGDTLSLGDKTLEFMLAPWVHWPETMFSYLQEDNVLFSCDFLGSHIAFSGLFMRDEAKVYEAAKRYYAEIMMPFRSMVKRHLRKIRDLDVEMIAPSHGPIHDNPGFILDAYDEWTRDESKNEVIIPYVSMHGSTAKMVDHLTEALIRRGITVKPFNLTSADIGEIAISLVDAATVVVGAPIVLAGPHPTAIHGVALVNCLRPKLKYAGVIGSYGWGGKLVEQITGMLGNLKVELLEPVVVKGYPKSEDLGKLEELADEIQRKHESSDLILT